MGPIVEKVERRLAGWERNYLSRGGRLALIKSVLGNLLIYYMSIFEMPKGIVRNFFWGDKDNRKRVHLIAWSEVTKPKPYSGLGVVPLEVRNQALLCKWSWRFDREGEAFWCRILVARFGVDDLGEWDLGESKKYESLLIRA